MHPVHISPSYFSKIHSNIILPSKPRSSNWSPTIRFSDQNFLRISHLPMHATCPALCSSSLCSLLQRPATFHIAILRGPSEIFVDSAYYSESELCGGAVTVSFSKHLPWQAMHFLQSSTHFSKMCCRPLITS
jgi:hypothetical protein